MYYWQHLLEFFLSVWSLGLNFTSVASGISMDLSKIASANIEKALSTFWSVLAETSKKVTPYSLAIASPFSYDFLKVTKKFLRY